MITFAAEMNELHIFNPEHDIALSSNLSNFTAPHAGRQLRADLGFLPAIWADEDDVVLVDNVEYAEKAWKRIAKKIPSRGNIFFLPRKKFFRLDDFEHINPWGWDKALASELKRQGINPALIPDEAQLEKIRQLSHRRVASTLLSQLQTKDTVGESFECTQLEEIAELLNRFGKVVMKAPWSSSGRGIRFVEGPLNNHLLGWLRNQLASQGSVMLEPYYKKVKDFGMEFHVDSDGKIHYKGLSLFHTVNGAYVGNVLATEETKREMINHYIPISFIDEIKEKICCSELLNGYQGPFGIDMMIVNSKRSMLNSQLHPCVEINLRRTMGHVALALSPTDDDVVKVMRIEYADNYKLKIRKL